MGRLAGELEREPADLTAIEAQIFTNLAKALLAKAEKGIDALISYQKDILGGELVWKVGREM